jgi:hypothetical protein
MQTRMSTLDIRFDLGAESGEEAQESTLAVEARLQAVRDRIRELPAAVGADHTRLWLDEAALLVRLQRGADAWTRARSTFDYLVESESWEAAVEACEILFLSDQPGSLAALGQGVWLAVTFPIDPRLTVSLLQHVVNDTPDDADGAAVAAATAAYIVGLRATGNQFNDLNFHTMQLLGSVARRHADIDDQGSFDAWTKRLELQDPEQFLVRLRNVVDVLVQDDWWLDRDAIRARLPVN